MIFNLEKAELVDGQMQCAQSIGSCRRSICECDLQFAQNIGKRKFKRGDFLVVFYKLYDPRKNFILEF